MAKTEGKTKKQWPPRMPPPELDYEVTGFLEGQPPPDPNAGWLKRLWYKLTGAI